MRYATIAALYLSAVLATGCYRTEPGDAKSETTAGAVELVVDEVNERSPPWVARSPRPVFEPHTPVGFRNSCDAGMLGGETYYLPGRQVTLGGLTLSAVHLMPESSFKHYEPSDTATSPVTLMFDTVQGANPIVYPQDTVDRPRGIVVPATAYETRLEGNENACVLRFMGRLPDGRRIRFDARQVMAPLPLLQAARPLNNFKPGGHIYAVLHGVLGVGDQTSPVDLGLMEWEPCKPGGRLSFDLSCGGVDGR